MECIIFQNVKNLGIKTTQLRRVVFSVLRQEKKKADLSVHLIGDARMKKLNRSYRRKDRMTDVLSFATKDGKKLGNQLDLGDIFISVPQIRRQAKDFGVLYKEEFFRLLIHGVLHLLGYDHMKNRDALIMFAKQEKYLNQI